MGLFLRIARADLVRAMAAPREHATPAGFALHGVGEGWLASPHFSLSEPGTPDLLITSSDTSAPYREGPWRLEVGSSKIRLFTSIDHSGPIPDRLEIAGGREQSVSLQNGGNPATPSVLADRYSRTAGAVSQDVWDRLSRAHLVLVGCSRTGSPLARMLARCGVGRLSLIDPDRLEAHNLDALGHPDDLGAFKAEVLGNELTATATRTFVDLVPGDISSRSATRLAADADVVISCVDNPQARQACAAIASAMLRTHLDIGTGVFIDGNDRTAGADIRILGPGDGCMLCVGGLAASPTDAEGPFPGPRAGSDPGLNYTAAGLAFRELTRWFTSGASPRWIGMEATNLSSHDTAGPRPGCQVCRSRGRGWPGLRHCLASIDPSLHATTT